MDARATNEKLIAAGLTPEQAKVITTVIVYSGVKDTLVIYEKLIAAGFTHEQAKGLTNVFVKTLGIKSAAKVNAARFKRRLKRRLIT